MIFSPSDLCRKSRPSHIWEHRIVILCKAHKEHIIYICVCTHFLSIISSAKSVNNTKFHHQCAGKQGARKVCTLLHVILYSFSKYIEEGASSWRPAPELAASFIGGAVRGRMARQDGGTSTQTAAVMIMIIVCHDHCDGGGCGALQS